MAAMAALRVLVVGKGGREHALCHAFRSDPDVGKVFCAPGNPGIAEDATCAHLPVKPPFSEIAAFAREKKIGLVVVGPEDPLALGIVDVLSAAGIPTFGPTQAAAQIESSKIFANGLMEELGIPSPAFKPLRDIAHARKFLEGVSFPCVLKADGLAAGKGVLILRDSSELEAALETFFTKKEFGEAGKKVLWEEYLAGEEASVLAFTDGKTVRPLLPAQDHKRIFNGDRGPNTGGMGAYAPAPVVNKAVLDVIVKEILQPVVKGMAERGTPYRGVLYAGLAIDARGPKVLEFNCRFGDPETQAILPLLKTPLSRIALACTNGTLAQVPVEFEAGSCVCVVLASAGYPGAYEKGTPIRGLADVPDGAVTIYHAGTAKKNRRWVTDGGRVLGVTAKGKDFAEARERAYAAIEKVSFPGMQYRKDIGAKARGRSKR
jgi:phosphoribosylamine--glycine ligase